MSLSAQSLWLIPALPLLAAALGALAPRRARTLAVGLALIIAVYRHQQSIRLQEANRLKG